MAAAAAQPLRSSVVARQKCLQRLLRRRCSRTHARISCRALQLHHNVHQLVQLPSSRPCGNSHRLTLLRPTRFSSCARRCLQQLQLHSERRLCACLEVLAAQGSCQQLCLLTTQQPGHCIQWVQRHLRGWESWGA